MIPKPQPTMPRSADHLDQKSIPAPLVHVVHAVHAPRHCTPHSKGATNRPIYMVHLRPEPGIEPYRARRGALKVLLRRFSLRCLSVTEAGKRRRR
jgi:hypothetical protein